MPYQWRIQSRSKDKTKVMCAPYVDARDVMNRLDEVCPEWSCTYSEIAGFVFCTISIPYGNTVITRSDCGQRIESNPDDQMYDQAGKSAASDALKRAAVAFGVGRFLYDIDMVYLKGDTYGNPVDDQGNRIWDVTKYINQPKANKVVKSPEPALPKLTQEKQDAMLKFITEGKKDEVRKAMTKYSMTTAQRVALESLLN